MKIKTYNKYNCDSYDSGYCYCLGRPLTGEEDDMCEDICCADNTQEENQWKD